MNTQCEVADPNLKKQNTRVETIVYKAMSSLPNLEGVKLIMPSLRCSNSVGFIVTNRMVIDARNI